MTPENLSRDEIERAQSTKLKSLVRAIVGRNPFWTQRFSDAGLAADDVTSVRDLSRLPPVTKADLAADQDRSPPYGTNLTEPLSAYCRLHQTSGTTGQPLRWLDTPES